MEALVTGEGFGLQAARGRAHRYRTHRGGRVRPSAPDGEARPKPLAGNLQPLEP